MRSWVLLSHTVLSCKSPRKDRPGSTNSEQFPTLRGAIEEELEREGILVKITHSEWATPVVAVPKPDGQVHLCGDFKVTINQALQVDQYPLPMAQDLFATWQVGNISLNWISPKLTSS